MLFPSEVNFLFRIHLSLVICLVSTKNLKAGILFFLYIHTHTYLSLPFFRRTGIISGEASKNSDFNKETNLRKHSSEEGSLRNLGR